MFRAESLVVYPSQGVGKIERIDHKNIGGMSSDFYIVRIHSNNITLMVPVKNAANVGLRLPVSRTEALNIMEFLKGNMDQIIFTGQNWNRRFREYSERLKSPQLLVVANVLRELLLIGRHKDLSFGERRLLEQAMSLVIGEIAVVLNVPADNLRDELATHYGSHHIEVEEQKSA